LTGFHPGAAGGILLPEVEAVGAGGTASDSAAGHPGGVGGGQPGAIRVSGVLIRVVC